MTYNFEADGGGTRENIEMSQNVMFLEEQLIHALAVYFTFWSTDEMISKLSEYGLTDPQIIAVRVDDKLILVAAESGSSNGIDQSYNNNDGNHTLVIVNNGTLVMNTNDSDQMAESGGGYVQSTVFLTKLASTLGFAVVLLDLLV
mmetsp:Transcript_6942/g.17003  ORF Transcript_6942/g.17003 Transcript_6942/m.17003 type:complete len:145 (+) Transcript_6942:1-435(+)